MKKPALGGLDLTGYHEDQPMSQNTTSPDEVLAYAESVSGGTLAVLRQSYDDLHERANKLSTWLIAGGGGVGAYALAQMAEKAPALHWAPLAALSLCWFGIAGPLIWSGATSTKLSPGNGPRNLLAYYAERLKDGIGPADALSQTREAELGLVQRRIRDYSDACVRRAEAIDIAYKATAALSPTVVAAVAFVTHMIVG